MKDPIKLPIRPDSGPEVELKKFLRQKVRGLKSGLKVIHNKVTDWRRDYEARPINPVRHVPFENASNLVIPIIAIHSDTLLARVMSSVLKTIPPWVVRIYNDSLDDHASTGDTRDALEEGLSFLGLEPSELDLYRVYHEWFGEAIPFGTSTIKMPFVDRIFYEPTASGDDTVGGKLKYKKRQLKYGPAPTKLRFDDFFISPSATSVESDEFHFHNVRLQREEIEDRVIDGIYEKLAAFEVLKSPDRTHPDTNQSQAESDAGAQTEAGYGFEEWDICECHFFYRVQGYKVKCLVWYHEATNQILRGFFQYYPDDIFITARLFYRNDSFHGYGFCEILAPHQEEISQCHNGRRDNQTVSNCKFFRANTDSPLHQGYKIFPSALVPADKDELEAIAMGEVSPGNIEEEKLSLDLAEKRSGVSHPSQGMGSGVMQKRGIYSAMGTLSMLQEGNTRTDLNVTDIRYAHAKVGRLICREYAEFGIRNKLNFLGEKKQALFEKALETFKKGGLAIPIYASSASLNREVEKQNDMMMEQVNMKHLQAITNMVGMFANITTPDKVKEYLLKAMDSANNFHKATLRHFGYDEVDRLVPDVDAKELQSKQPATPQAVVPGQRPPLPAGQPPVPGGQSPVAGGPAPSGNGGIPMPPLAPAGPPIPGVGGGGTVQ